MGRLKWWLIGAGAVCIALVAALCVGAWNEISSEWQVEQAAAQYALNHSPIDHIQGHDVFTGAGTEEVFYGQDAFGHDWYAFVDGSPFSIQIQSASGILSAAKVQKAALANQVKPISEHIGYLNQAAASSFSAKAGPVWEIYGTTPSGKHVYLYVNARTGKQLWKYVLQQNATAGGILN